MRLRPGLGTYIGVTRIAHAFFSSHHPSSLTWTEKSFKAMRGIVEILGVGIILLPIDLFSWASKTFKKNDLPPAADLPPAPQVSNASRPRTQKKLKDSEIIDQLTQRKFDRPADEGGGGRCLFLSIQPQITESDLNLVRAKFPNTVSFSEWSRRSKEENADDLRFWAMQTERKFISSIRKSNRSYSQLDPLDRQWIREFYKDMYQEIHKVEADRVRIDTKDVTEEERLLFVKTHFDRYEEKTSCPTNESGSAEAISLSRLLQREIQMYGNDRASSEFVQLDADGNILPYCSYPGKKQPPIYVFQIGGGGHYRRLPLKDS